MNSVSTCIAPWTESGEPDERRPIKESRSSGYSSGQSQFAIEERVCAQRERIFRSLSESPLNTAFLIWAFISTGGAEPLKLEKNGDHLSFTYFRRAMLADCLRDISALCARISCDIDNPASGEAKYSANLSSAAILVLVSGFNVKVKHSAI